MNKKKCFKWILFLVFYFVAGLTVFMPTGGGIGVCGEAYRVYSPPKKTFLLKSSYFQKKNLDHFSGEWGPSIHEPGQNLGAGKG